MLGLLGLLFVLGCGGSDGATVDPVGIYSTSYSRAQGSIVIGIQSNGTVNIAIDDDTAGFFHGSGTLTHDNTFSINCAGPVPAIATVTGTVSCTGSTRVITGSVTGNVAVNYSASYERPPNSAVFEGSYRGVFSEENGAWAGDVNAQGQMMTSWHFDPEEDIEAEGLITPTGFIHLTGLLGSQEPFNAVGVFRLTPEGYVVMGSWTRGSRSGHWSGGMFLPQ